MSEKKEKEQEGLQAQSHKGNCETSIYTFVA